MPAITVLGSNLAITPLLDRMARQVALLCPPFGLVLGLVGNGISVTIRRAIRQIVRSDKRGSRFGPTLPLQLQRRKSLRIILALSLQMGAATTGSAFRTIILTPTLVPTPRRHAALARLTPPDQVILQGRSRRVRG